MSDDSQERTEDATPKREKETKKKGQVARSKDFNTAILLICSGVSFALFGTFVVEHCFKIFEIAFNPKTENIRSMNTLFSILHEAAYLGFVLLIPLFIINIFASFIGPVLVGNWIFAVDNFNFKLERLDPIKGLKKIFSIKSLMEIVKSILKFFLVLGVALLLFKMLFFSIMALSVFNVEEAIVHFSEILVFCFFVLTSSLILIAAIDVPFQISQHLKQIKMTKQEVKDESKETEGKPEVKSQIARLQREMSKRRMMGNVPDADVIITNPTHFAVAIQYDDKIMKAPKLLAKGADNMAGKIRQVADHNKIPIVQMPLLARAIFYNTEIDDEIPSQLYVACAQVLAYVYKLKMYKKGKESKPKLPKNINIPSDMVR
tara:strand:+ start:103926 stop:105050 length:1125 start_codon:yes stop_codon:yes gene_type:complete